MAVNGTRFLRLGKAQEFTISHHALKRLYEHTGREFTEDDAFLYFCQSKQLKFEEMGERGYRPGFQQRMNRGIHSWYFLLPESFHELIAVITKNETNGEYVWITTYAPNHLTRANVAWMENTAAKMVA